MLVLVSVEASGAEVDPSEIFGLAQRRETVLQMQPEVRAFVLTQDVTERHNRSLKSFCKFYSVHVKHQDHVRANKKQSLGHNPVFS